MKRLITGIFLSSVIVFPALAALEEGDQAPDFTAKASLAGKEFYFSLNEALKKGPVVVYFYPSAYTNGCNIEAHTFAEEKNRQGGEKQWSGETDSSGFGDRQIGQANKQAGDRQD